MVVTWCYGSLLSLGYYGSHERDRGAYTQEVAKVSMKRYCIVGNTTCSVPDGDGNNFYISMGRL